MTELNLKHCDALEIGKVYIVDRGEFHGEEVENVVAGPFDSFEDAAATRRAIRATNPDPGRFMVVGRV